MRMGKSLFKTKKRHLPNQRLDPSSPPKKKNAHLNWWRVCFSLKVTPIQIHPKTPNNQRPQPDSVVGVVAVGPPAVVRGSSFLRIFSGTMSNLDKSWRSARERERETPKQRSDGHIGGRASGGSPPFAGTTGSIAIFGLAFLFGV